jgi:RNA polymerase sigma-70 factor (ECF subfamily)
VGTTETDGQPDWDQLRRQLTAFVARRVGPEATEDVVQQTLLAMYSNLSSLHVSDRLDAWAFQIARNTIADHHRRRAADGRRAEAVAAQTSTQPAPVTPDLTVEPETEQQLATCVSPLLGRLPGPYREAITLADIQGLTQASAAEQLNLSVPGMKSRVQRGREKLRAMLLECCEVEFDPRGGAVDYRLKSAEGGWCSCPDDAGGSTDGGGT